MLFVIITHCYTFIPFCFFIFFYTHSSFVLSFFIFFYPCRSSSRFMNDVFFGAHQPVIGHCSFGCRVESPYSHGLPIFDIVHTEAWHYLLGIWAFVSRRFIHLLPLVFIMVRVIRPPWGYEISCLLRSISFGQAPSTNWSMGCRQGSISWGISRIAYCFSVSSLRLWATIRDKWCWESRLSRTLSTC